MDSKQNQEIVFLEFFCFNFFDNLETAVAVYFLTPHVSEDLTTVKSSEPAPPQGGSYSSLA